MKLTPAHETILSTLKEGGVQFLSNFATDPVQKRKVPTMVTAGLIEVVAVPVKLAKARTEMKLRGRPPTKAYKITRDGGKVLKALQKARA